MRKLFSTLLVFALLRSAGRRLCQNAPPPIYSDICAESAQLHLAAEMSDWIFHQEQCNLPDAGRVYLCRFCSIPISSGFP